MYIDQVLQRIASYVGITHLKQNQAILNLLGKVYQELQANPRTN